MASLLVNATLLDETWRILEDLRAAQGDVVLQIAAVEKDGYTEASEYWRDGVYLYLIHPMNNGQRKREYIGADPEKIKAAQQRVANHRRLVDLQGQHKDLEREIYHIESKIQELHREAQRATYLLQPAEEKA